MKKNTTSVKNIGIKAVICFWVFGFFLLKLVYAQSGTNIRFKRISLEQGLSQATVFCIIQDRLGFMWFGTQDGLNRYDGYSFKIFKNDPSDSASLANNFIFSIYENKFGDLYIESQNGTLHLYTPLSESFQIVDKDSLSLKEKIN